MIGLSALAGNPTIHRQLSDASRLSHAYILSGPTGSGRHTLARLLAKMLVCSGTGARPCGQCSNCKKAEEGIHPDIITLGDGGAIPIAQVRQMRTDAYIRPNEAARKVYLVENAGAMNEMAQNVLLKLVEEGPEYAAFLFLTDHAGQMLQTIRSRCEELKLTPVPFDACVEELTRRFPKTAPEEIAQAARACGGLLGDAIPLLEQQKASPEEEEALALSAEFCAALARGDELSLGAFLARHEKLPRQELSALCVQCRRAVHQALLCRSGVDTGTARAELAVHLNQGQLLTIDRLLENAIQALEGNGGSGHVLGLLIVSCMQAISSTTAPRGAPGGTQ